jgi:hypothetical protein
MIITDDVCNELTYKIMEIFYQYVDFTQENDEKIYDEVLELLVDKLESNGYVNHN